MLQLNLLFNSLLFWKYKARFRVSVLLSGNVSSNYTLPRNANFVHFFSELDDTHLVVGMSNGLLSIRHHIKPPKNRQETPQGRVRPRGGTYRYFVRGKTSLLGRSVTRGFEITCLCANEMHRLTYYEFGNIFKNALQRSKHAGTVKEIHNVSGSAVSPWLHRALLVAEHCCARLFVLKRSSSFGVGKLQTWGLEEFLAAECLSCSRDV